MSGGRVLGDVRKDIEEVGTEQWAVYNIRSAQNVSTFIYFGTHISLHIFLIYIAMGQ